MKKLTMITISYNCKDLIEATIQSVIRQKTDEIEYIIIDGDSNDGTNEIIEKNLDYIDKYVCEKDNGISDAFNKGIKMATGRWVGLINAGDLIIDGAFDILERYLNTEDDVLFANGIRQYLDGTYKPWFANPDPRNLHYCMSMVHPSVFVKKETYIKYGMFNINFKCVMDRELLLRFLNEGCRFRYLDEYISVYLMGGVSDKKYYTVVLKEELQIDKMDGMSLSRRCIKYCRYILIHFAVNVRNLLGLNKTYESLESAMRSRNDNKKN